MPVETGPNEGVAGTGTGVAMVTIDGVGALFAIDIDDFDLGLHADLVKTTGPADPVGDATFRAGDTTGQWTGRGRVKGDKRPMPLRLGTRTGNMRIAQMRIGDGDGNTAAVNYYDFTAVFTNIDFSHAPTDQGGEDAWQVEFTVTKTGALTPAWNNYDGSVEGTLTPALTAAWKEIWAGRSKTIDPAAAKVDHSATSVYDIVGAGTSNANEVAVMGSLTAAAAGSPPQTGLKIARAGFTRIDGLGAQAVLNWELDDSNDRIVNGRASARINLTSERTLTTVELLDTTSDVDTILDAYLAAFQSEENAAELAVQKVNNTTAAIIKQYVDPGVGVNGRTEDLTSYQIARVSGGNVQVFVTEVLHRGTGRYLLRLGRSYVRRVARRFKLRRYFSGSTIPDQAALAGKLNNATFLGLAAGKVMYLSAGELTNIGLSTPYQFQMDYDFEWLSDSGFYGLDGWQWEVRTATAGITAGWHNVSSLGVAGLTASVPSQGDFAPFLS